MTATWVLASGNRGKLRELSARLAPHSIALRPQSDFGLDPVPETGTTFVENAIIMARAAAAVAGLPALADDSGLEVAALRGAPGIHSARYAGAGAAAADNNAKLLAALAGESDRRARFCCVLVWMAHPRDPLPRIFQATWAGTITTAPAGGGGFGYDPVFRVPEHGCTSAQLEPELKNQISHRGKAIDLLLAALAAGDFGPEGF